MLQLGAADPAGAQAPEPADPAVARLNHAGYARKRHCTAVAVAPRVALTAAHCLDGVPADEFHLLFGYARMGWAGEGRIGAVHPLGGDLAALCLVEPAPAVRPVGPPPRQGEPVRLVGYGRPRTHVQHPRTCAVLGRGGGRLGIDCPATQGDSGGPVIDREGRVVGILSRAGHADALAVGVPADAAAACGR